MGKTLQQQTQPPETVKLWQEPFIRITIYLFGFILVAGAAILLTIVIKMGMQTLQEQMFGIRLMQLTLGIVIGLAMILLGTLLSWFGVKESTQMEVRSTGIAAKLGTAGPGAVLVICGTVVICLCIQKEFRISTSEPIPTIQFEKSTEPQ
ncbi:MAG: hypothetical protein ABSA16_02060 [Thermoguttaceae bacterium]|jgi:TRAP-type C4-dicarboxylate transport system permease small subunit